MLTNNILSCTIKPSVFSQCFGTSSVAVLYSYDLPLQSGLQACPDKRPYAAGEVDENNK